MFKGLTITCDEATAICDKNQYGEATFMEKVKLNIHFLRCKFCRLYTKQNMFLTKIYKNQANACKEHKHCMSSTDKEALKKEFEKIKL